MEESLEREIHRCHRSQKGLGLIMADIDHFKKFNDTYGHDAGDIVLISFANILSNHFRSSDIVCRFGGEEFIIIMPETTRDNVVSRAEELCKLISELENLYDGKLLPSVTSSFGVAFIDGVVRDKNLLIKAADLALYEAKNAGRNQVVVSTNQFK